MPTQARRTPAERSAQRGPQQVELAEHQREVRRERRAAVRQTAAQRERRLERVAPKAAVAERRVVRRERRAAQRVTPERQAQREMALAPHRI